MNRTGLVFDISHYMIEDGPGIRTSIFMKGCPLRCKWCSNAYGLKKRIELSFNKAKCTGCRACLAACAHNAITWDEKTNSIVQDFSSCKHCMKCVSVCRPKARTQIGFNMNVEDVVSEVIKDRAFYRRGNGGVTVSGGELLMQPDFVSEVLKSCQNEGINTAIETSAYGKWNDLSKIIEYCDNVFIDCKAIDGELHKELTGVDNRIILENIEKSAQICDDNGINLVVRFPLIPTLNDSVDNMTKVAKFVNSLPGNILLNILPYHNYGGQKYEYLGEVYTTETIEPLSGKELDEVNEFFKRVSKRFSIGGYNIDFE